MQPSSQPIPNQRPMKRRAIEESDDESINNENDFLSSIREMIKSEIQVQTDSIKGHLSNIIFTAMKEQKEDVGAMTNTLEDLIHLKMDNFGRRMLNTSQFTRSSSPTVQTNADSDSLPNEGNVDNIESSSYSTGNKEKKKQFRAPAINVSN